MQKHVFHFPYHHLKVQFIPMYHCLQVQCIMKVQDYFKNFNNINRRQLPQKNSLWLTQILVYSIYHNLGFLADSSTVTAMIKLCHDSLIVLQLLCTFSSVDKYSFDPPVHMADLQTVNNILSHFQIFTLCNSPGSILKYTMANDILTYYLHAWGMYNWNLFVGVHRWRYCNNWEKSPQALRVLLVHNWACPACKELLGLLPKPLSCSLLSMAIKCECMAYRDYL